MVSVRSFLDICTVPVTTINGCMDTKGAGPSVRGAIEASGMSNSRIARLVTVAGYVRGVIRDPTLSRMS